MTSSMLAYHIFFYTSYRTEGQYHMYQYVYAVGWLVSHTGSLMLKHETLVDRGYA